MTTWDAGVEPPTVRIGPMGWVRVVARGLVLGVIVFGCLGLLLVVRLVERPLFGMHRPWTPWITQFVCSMAFVVLGISYRVEGTRMTHRGVVVSNHVSWLDIFALNARKRVYFVSKAEVAGWPGIGWLARATGTVFIKRDRREAKAQQTVFEERLLAGHKLLFFPEGTSTDGRRVLPFKTTLFQSFFTQQLRHELYVQPVTLIYRAPRGTDARFYGWWGDMEFGPHLLQTLSARRQGAVTVKYHPPVRVDAFENRKALAAHCEAVVRSGLPEDLRDE
ncbi:MAG: 1-acyl-sn-glycerol-3-phosphate acyltransferase [Rhodobacterales bacterium]|nr:MAG: 1-acyl-sn-glycerol-3-phosphate acyltransferase [Rhodobacterales bacterium]